MKRIAALVLLAILLAMAAVCCGETVVDEDEPPAVIDRISNPAAWKDFSFPENAKLLHIWFANIRDADAAVLSYDGEVWMIDCGDERAGRITGEMLEQLQINRIDRLFISHPHHDHMDGILQITRAARVREMLISFPEDSTETMIRVMGYLRDPSLTGGNRIRTVHYGDEDVFEMGDGKVTAQVWMKSGEERSMNDRSSQMMIRFGDRKILFTADMERPGQRDLLEAVGAGELQADLLKYPHHGKLPLVDEFLKAVKPYGAVITNFRGAGEHTYCLKLRRVVPLYTNRKDVYMHLVTDGKHWICEDLPIEKSVKTIDKPVEE